MTTSMPSDPERPSPLDDFVLTPEDIEAMRRSADAARTMSSAEYLRFLERSSAHVAPSRKTSEGWAPFDLRDLAKSTEE